MRLAAPAAYRPGVPAQAKLGEQTPGEPKTGAGPRFPERKSPSPAATVRAARSIQRKVGFELEMSVPTFGPPGVAHPNWFKDGPEGQKPDPKIEQFLFAGIDYGAKMGENQNFRLTSDHNELQGKGRAIVNKLLEMKYVLDVPEKYKTFCNLEYVTHPLEELSAGSTTKFQRQFDAMRQHMKDVLAEAPTKLRKIPAPAGEYYTGVPVTELQAWLGDDYAQLQGTITAFQQQIHDQLYLQATVGIIPSALRDLHKRQIPASEDAYTLFHRVAVLADNWIENVVQKLVEKDDYFKSLAGPATFPSWSSKSPAIDLEAMKGVLLMILMYMVGSALNQTTVFTGSTSKNSVLFMSKMNLGGIQRDAMPNYQRGFFGSTPPSSTISKIAIYLKGFPQTKVDYWVKNGLTLPTEEAEKKERKPFITDPDTFISNVLKGYDVAAVNTGSSRQLGVDVMPEPVKTASAGQAGVTVEYRHISDRPTPDTMDAPLLKIVRDIRELNTKHMASKARQELIEAADK